MELNASNHSDSKLTFSCHSLSAQTEPLFLDLERSPKRVETYCEQIRNLFVFYYFIQLW